MICCHHDFSTRRRFRLRSRFLRPHSVSAHRRERMPVGVLLTITKPHFEGHRGEESGLNQETNVGCGRGGPDRWI